MLIDSQLPVRTMDTILNLPPSFSRGVVMPNAAHDGEQSPSLASDILRRSSDIEAIELGRQTQAQFVRVDPTPNPRHGQLRRRVSRLWARHISMGVPHEACRDHLANERTFLGYLRTSQIFSMIGIFIAQFFRLQHSATPDPILGFYVVSIPLSAIFQVFAILVLSIGCARYFKLQKTMALGKIISGGWEILVVGGFSAAVREITATETSRNSLTLNRFFLPLLYLFLPSRSREPDYWASDPCEVTLFARKHQCRIRTGFNVR